MVSIMSSKTVNKIRSLEKKRRGNNRLRSLLNREAFGHIRRFKNGKYTSRMLPVPASILVGRLLHLKKVFILTKNLVFHQLLESFNPGKAITQLKVQAFISNVAMERPDLTSKL